MKKAWRNPRQVIINQVPAEPEDARRLARLTSLLATGVERLLATRSTNSEANLVDFQTNVLVNTHTAEEASQTESK